MPPAPSARGLQGLAYALHLFVVGEAGQGRLEKEEAQHGKHDEELDENDAPQGAPPRHLPKSVAIEAPDAAQTCGDVFQYSMVLISAIRQVLLQWVEHFSLQYYRSCQ